MGEVPTTMGQLLLLTMVAQLFAINRITARDDNLIIDFIYFGFWLTKIEITTAACANTNHPNHGSYLMRLFDSERGLTRIIQLQTLIIQTRQLRTCSIFLERKLSEGGLTQSYQLLINDFKL